MSRFRRMRSLQKFVSIHSTVYNHFNFQRHISPRNRFKQRRGAAHRQWRDPLVAWHLLVPQLTETGSHSPDSALWEGNSMNTAAWKPPD